MDAAANTDIVPLSGEGWANSVWIDGHNSTQRQDSNFSSVTSAYFDTLRIPMIVGHAFNDHETRQSPRAATSDGEVSEEVKIFLCTYLLSEAQRFFSQSLKGH